MDTILAVFLLLMLIGQAFGGERMSCEVQPMRGDGREWHYRTKVGGDPRICWYPGERMKPRSELTGILTQHAFLPLPVTRLSPKILLSSSLTRSSAKTLLSSSLARMATLPSAGARSMAAEQDKDPGWMCGCVTDLKGQLNYCLANQFVNGRLTIAAALPR